MWLSSRISVLAASRKFEVQGFFMNFGFALVATRELEVVSCFPNLFPNLGFCPLGNARSDWKCFRRSDISIWPGRMRGVIEGRSMWVSATATATAQQQQWERRGITEGVPNPNQRLQIHKFTPVCKSCRGFRKRVYTGRQQTPLHTRLQSRSPNLKARALQQ